MVRQKLSSMRQSSVQLRHDVPYKILIVIIAGIGDFVLATPGIRSIRNGHPDAEIHILSSTEAAVLARNLPYIDKVWSFPIREIRRNKGALLSILKTIWHLRQERFSLAVNLYRIWSVVGALRMGSLFKAVAPGYSVGHDFKGFGLFVDKKIPRGVFRGKHIADAMLSAAEAAGGKGDDKGLFISCGKSGQVRWQHLFGDSRKGRPIIGINPGGNLPAKHWPVDRFSRLADLLANHSNAELFIIGGPGEELIAQGIQERMKAPSANLAGQLSLDELVFLLSHLTMLITSDSGPMHIAAALRIPLVALFGSGDPVMFGPYPASEKFLVVESSRNGFGGIGGIGVEDVFSACCCLLEKFGT